MAKLKIGQKLKKLVGLAAPNLGRMLGGPLGGMAGNMIREGLGVDSDEAAAMMLESDPAAMAKVAEIESALEAKLAEAGVDLERVLAGDRADARHREVETGDSTPRNLAYLYSCGFFAVLAAQFYVVVASVAIDPSAMRILDTALGVLFAMVFASKDYYFGSSVGSKQKTAIMSYQQERDDAQNEREDVRQDRA
jgi:hypothetical protein